MYEYDTAARLSAVRENGTLVASYSYDGNSNRTSAVFGGTTVSASYDARDRILSAGATTYSHNDAGELVERTSADGLTTTYRFAAAGPMTDVTLSDGTHVSYLVDAAGRRVGRSINGALTQMFLYDGRRVIAELAGNGSVTARFVYLPDSHAPAYMVRNGLTFVIVVDHLGSARLVVNAATGQAEQRIDYDEFGAVQSDTNPGFQPFGFAGGLYDVDTGLVHLDNREYDPEAGRFTRVDPLLFDGGDANLYAYAKNDPVNNFDYTGKSPIAAVAAAEIGGVALAAGAAAGAACLAMPSNCRQVFEDVSEAAEDVVSDFFSKSGDKDVRPGETITIPGGPSPFAGPPPCDPDNQLQLCVAACKARFGTQPLRFGMCLTGCILGAM